MTIVLVFIAVAVVGATVLFALGRFRRPIEGNFRTVWEPGAVPVLDALAEPAATLPPVLLPDAPNQSDIARIRFAVGFRGYRMDQVDDVLDVLGRELARRNLMIAQLQAEREGRSG